MIDLITGVPGSGKTYYAVNQIHDLIIAKEKKYKHIFTNINGLDLKKCNELSNEFYYITIFEFMDLQKDIDLEYAYHQESKLITNEYEKIPLKFDKSFDYVSEENLKFYTKEQLKKYETEKEEFENQKLEHENYLNKKQRQKERETQLKEDYDNYVKSKGLYQKYQDSLIIIDECHLYFELKPNDKLIRFLSYHRHFNIDLYLITQNKNLISKLYLSFIETMYVAYPASKRFFSKSFRYKKYASYQEYHANIMGNTSLKLTEKIFSLYSSGSNVVGKSILSNMLLPIFIVILISFFAFYLLQDSMIQDIPEPKQKNNIDNNVSIHAPGKNKHNKVVYEDDEVSKNKKSFYVVDCFTTTCTFKKVDMTFTKKSMFEIIDQFKCNVITNNVTDLNYYTYILECDSKLNEILTLFNNKKFGVQNEKNSNTASSSNIFTR